MSDYFYECFIYSGQNFALLDLEGSIRATAPDLDGIFLVKKKYGWGRIVKITFDGKKLVVGEEIK
jgi:hypothetical protein